MHMFTVYRDMFFNDDLLNKFAILLILQSFVTIMLRCVLSEYNKRLRKHERQMKLLESDIRSERKKLMHERVELERKYHMYM